MNFLHQFTISVLLIAFLSSFCESLMCEGTLKKYASLVTGLIVSLCIVNAILQIRSVEFETVDFSQTAHAVQDASAQGAAVKEQFESDLEKAIEDSVFDRFKCRVRAYATVRVAEKEIYIERVEIDNTAIEESALFAFVETQFGVQAEIQ